MRVLIFLIPLISVAAIVPADISGVRPGPITVVCLHGILHRALAGRSIPHVERGILAEHREAADHRDRSGLDRRRPQCISTILGGDREAPRARGVRRVLRFSRQPSGRHAPVRGRIPAGEREGSERRQPGRGAVRRAEAGNFRGRASRIPFIRAAG